MVLRKSTSSSTEAQASQSPRSETAHVVRSANANEPTAMLEAFRQVLQQSLESLSNQIENMNTTLTSRLDALQRRLGQRSSNSSASSAIDQVAALRRDMSLLRFPASTTTNRESASTPSVSTSLPGFSFSVPRSGPNPPGTGGAEPRPPRSPLPSSGPPFNASSTLLSARSYFTALANSPRIGQQTRVFAPLGSSRPRAAAAQPAEEHSSPNFSVPGAWPGLLSAQSEDISGQALTGTIPRFTTRFSAPGSSATPVASITSNGDANNSNATTAANSSMQSHDEEPPPYPGLSYEAMRASGSRVSRREFQRFVEYMSQNPPLTNDSQRRLGL